MLVYRLQQSKYAHSREEILSGEGARRFGGRWNPKGLAVIYTSATPELAHTEFMIHFRNLTPPSCHLITLQIPDDSILILQKEDLPDDWRSKNEPISTKIIGEKWIKEGKFLTFRVPSAIVPMSFNYLINTKHPAIEDVNIIHSEPFIFDERFILEKPPTLMPSIIHKMLSK